jgi:transketolase
LHSFSATDYQELYMPSVTPLPSSIDLARQIRIHTVRMTAYANASHVGTGLSMADILAVLYSDILRVDPLHPDAPGRDKFVLSKGHGAAALYATLAECGFFSPSWLERFGEDNQPLAGHVTREGVPGVELSTGSLGHGLPVALGMALAARADGTGARSFAMLSDGELDEGSTWEAAMLAGHLKIGQLTVVIDCNGIQSFGRVKDVLDLEPLADKWKAFGWNVTEIDGHDHSALFKALSRSPGVQPQVIIARTIKGKGVSFMEDRLEWHYRSPGGDLLDKALAELGVSV